LDLTHFFARPVAVRFAGRRVAVQPLSFGQLASLQAFIGSAIGSPSERAAAELAPGLDAEGRRRVLVAAYDQAEAWPVAIGTAEADWVLDRAPGGRRLFLSLAVVGPALTSEDLDEAAKGATTAEWAALMRAAFGPSDQAAELARMIDPEAFAAREGTDGPAESAPWCRALAEAAERFGWGSAELESLTPAALAAFLSRGTRSTPDVPPRPGETRDEASERRKRYFDLDGEDGGDDGQR
jgi:hypothetical protein